MGRMSASRKLAFAAFAAFILAVAAITCFAPRGFLLVVFGDVFGLVLLLLAAAAMLQNAITQPRNRAFWGLLSAGCFLWAFNEAGWTWVEVILRRDLPDPRRSDHQSPSAGAAGHEVRLSYRARPALRHPRP